MVYGAALAAAIVLVIVTWPSGKPADAGNPAPAVPALSKGSAPIAIFVTDSNQVIMRDPDTETWRQVAADEIIDVIRRTDANSSGRAVEIVAQSDAQMDLTVKVLDRARQSGAPLMSIKAVE